MAIGQWDQRLFKLTFLSISTFLIVWACIQYFICHLLLFDKNSDDIWSDVIFFTSNANGGRILVGKYLLILQKNVISWKLWYHYIMHGGHYSNCKEKWKEKWAWTKESCCVGLWMILNIFLFSNIKNLIGTKNKTFLICRLMDFNPICSHT